MNCKTQTKCLYTHATSTANGLRRSHFQPVLCYPVGVFQLLLQAQVLRRWLTHGSQSAPSFSPAASLSFPSVSPGLSLIPFQPQHRLQLPQALHCNWAVWWLVQMVDSWWMCTRQWPLHSWLEVRGVTHRCKGVSRLRKHANKIQKQFIWECLYHTALMPFKWGGCAPGISTNRLTNDSISVGVCEWVPPARARVFMRKRVWYPFCLYAFVSFTGDQSRLSTQPFPCHPLITAHYLL